jgi:hypothetical protein
VEGGGGGLTVNGVSRNRGGFVKCVAIQKMLGIPAIERSELCQPKRNTAYVVPSTLLDKSMSYRAQC